MEKMFQRLLRLPDTRSLFLFGARNTGKSTLVKKKYRDCQEASKRSEVATDKGFQQKNQVIAYL